MKKVYSGMALPWKTRLEIRWLLRKQFNRQTQILGTAGQIPEKVLILLPADEDIARVARHFIRRTTWVGNPGYRFLSQPGGDEFYSFLKTQRSSWTESDLTRWGTLNREVVSQVVPRSVDAVINLDPRPSPVWVDIIRRSPAWLKIGFNFPGAARLYNVLLAVQNGSYVERGYQIIKQLLAAAKPKTPSI